MDWLPVCGTLRRIIASRLNFEIRIGEAHSIHEFDWDKVMEPCISKVEKAQHAEFNVPTCAKMAFWQVCRETQPLWNSHDSWWPELNMFGSMPWCSFPCQKLLPKLAQKEVLYSLNLIHEFTSLFSPKVIFAGLPGKAFPRKHAFVDISVFLWLRKQRPRFAQGQPKGYSQLKELHRTTQAIAQMNADWKVEKGHYAEFNVPTCCKIAVWLLRRETQPLWNSHDSWWPELKMFGWLPWSSFPWQKLLPSLAQKTCFTVSLNLIHELTSLFWPKVISAGVLGKAFPGIRSL